MCGITGFIDYKKKFTIKNLELITKKLIHRGPDYSNCFFENNKNFNIGLGHTRLSIVDLSDNGNQPMISSDKKKIKVWVDKISEPFNAINDKNNEIQEIEDKIKQKIKNIEENEDCEEVELGNVCDIKIGTRITKNNNSGDVPVYGGGDITFYTDKTNREANTLIVSRYAMSPLCTRLISQDFYLNDSGLSLHFDNTKKQNYMNYLFQMDDQRKYIYNNCTMGSIQRNINIDMFKKMKIKIPTNKKLIEKMQKYFDKVETLKKEVKEAEVLYDKYIKQLGKEAIVSN